MKINTYLAGNYINGMEKSKTIAGINQKASRTLSAQILDSCGSIKGKYPVVIDGGKTTIYISDKSKEAEIIERYKARMKR